MDKQKKDNFVKYGLYAGETLIIQGFRDGKVLDDLQTTITASEDLDVCIYIKRKPASVTIE